MLWAVDRSAHTEEASTEDKFPTDTQVTLLHVLLTDKGTEMVGSRATPEVTAMIIMRIKAVGAQRTLPTKEAVSTAQEDPALVREIDQLNELSSCRSYC